MSLKQTPIIINPSRPSNGIDTLAHKASITGLNENEKISVRALVAYAAMNIGALEEEIQQCLSTKFAAANIDHLPSRSYEDVIKFLVDLCDEEPEEGSAQ